jgi:hypothetical protein
VRDLVVPYLFDAGNAASVRMPTRFLYLFVAATTLTGCAGGPGPGDRGYAFNLAGAYYGRAHLEGAPIDARASFRTARGGRVSGTFEVPSATIVGDVDGVIVDDLLRIRVGYRSLGGCDGVIEGILTIEPGGEIVEGPVTVRDCGEPVAGRLALRRTPPDGTGAASEADQSFSGSPPERAER